MTDFICDVGSGAADYSSHASWESAVGSDLTAAANKVFGISGHTGSVGDGASVTGASSGATGAVFHVKGDDSQVYIAVLTGTFSSGEQMEVDGSNYVTLSDAGAQITNAICNKTDLEDVVAEDNVTNFTTSSTRKLKYTANTKHDGTPGSGDGFSNNQGSSWGMIRLSAGADYTTFDGITLSALDGGGAQRGVRVDTLSTTAAEILLLNLMLERQIQIVVTPVSNWPQSVLLANCIGHEMMYGVIGNSGNANLVKAFNCSFQGQGGTLRNGFRYVDVRNCWAGGFSEGVGSYWNIFQSGSNSVFGGCYSTDASPDIPSGNRSKTATDQFVGDPAPASTTADFHVKNTSADIYHGGVAIAGITNDADGVSYDSPPSSGAYEFVASGSPLSAGLGTPVSFRVLMEGNTNFPQSWASRLAVKSGSPSEALAAITLGASAPAAFILGLRAGYVLDVDSVTLLDAPGFVPTSWLSEQSVEVRLGAEILADVIAKNQSPVAWSGGIGVSADHPSPVDFLADIRTATGLPVPWLRAIIGTTDLPLSGSLRTDAGYPAPLSWSGAIGISSDHPAPVDFLSGIAAGALLQSDWLRDFATAAGVPGELLASAVTGAAALLEWTGRLVADTVSLPVDIAALLMFDTGADVEVLASPRPVFKVPASFLGTVLDAQELPVSWEGAATLRAGFTLPLAWVDPVPPGTPETVFQTTARSGVFVTTGDGRIFATSPRKKSFDA